MIIEQHRVCWLYPTSSTNPTGKVISYWLSFIITETITAKPKHFDIKYIALVFQACTVGCVKNTSKRVLKNLTRIFWWYFMYTFVLNMFERIFAGGKWTSKRGLSIKKLKFHAGQTKACGVCIQTHWPGILALCTQISILVSVSGEVAPKGQISECTLRFALWGPLLQISSPKLKS